MYNTLDFKEFLSIDSPHIDISSHFKKQLLEECDTELIVSIDTKKIQSKLLLAKEQYRKKDNKWILSLAGYLYKMGNEYYIINRYSTAADYFYNSMKLSLLEREKAINWNMKDQLANINSYLEDAVRYYISSKICILFERNKMINNIEEIKELLKKDLRDIKFLKKEKVDLIMAQAYLVALREFSFLLTVDELITISEDFININDNQIFHFLLQVNRGKFKEVRKLAFKNWMPTIGLQEKKEIKDLIELREHSIKINKLLGEKRHALFDESELYKFKAYLITDLNTASQFFDKSMEALKTIRKSFPDSSDEKDKIQREIIFTAARKFEYLAALETDRNKQIEFLSKAEHHYGELRSAMSYYLQFIIFYFKLKNIISSESKPDEISTLCKKIIDEFPSIENFWKFPLFQMLYKIIDILSFWQSNPSERRIFELMQKASIILDPSDFIKSVYRLTLSFCLVSNLFKEQAVVLCKYFADILKYLIENQKIDIAILTNHIHYVEEADSKEILEQIIKDEGQELEFKGSFKFDVNRYLESGSKESTEREEESLLKTIVGFLNSKGGRIIVGLLESNRFKQYSSRLRQIGDKLILGINFEYGKYEYDGYERTMKDIIRTQIDSSLISLLTFHKHTVDRIDILEINVPSMITKGKRYYWKRKFYVREGNETIMKEGEELINYLQNIQNLIISGLSPE